MANHSDLISIPRLGLTKLYLWPEAERIQTYPQALARLAEHSELKQGATRRQIGEHIFQLAYIKDRKPLRENVLTNCFGLVRVAKDKLVIRGINLFRRKEAARLHQLTNSRLAYWETKDDLWLPTKPAMALGQAYNDEPRGLLWQQLLAEQLGRYEVRTRLLLGLLAEGRRLVFPRGDFFAGKNRLVQLVDKEKPLFLFANDGVQFNTLLAERISTALGPWWQTELTQYGYSLTPDFTLEGVHNGPPTILKLSSKLRSSLIVFKNLGILVKQDDGWGVDVNTAAHHLSAELVGELTGTVRSTISCSPYDALSQAVDELADERGFVITAQLATRWAELQGMSPNTEASQHFDNFIRRSLYQGIVRVVDSHPGQPRMGQGLLGNEDQRRIRLTILAS